MDCPTVAVINLDRYIHHIRDIRTQTGASVLAMVKANGYGCGSIQLAQAAVTAGVSGLGVAWVSEGIVLRNAGISAPISIFSEGNLSDADYIADYRLTAVVYSDTMIGQLSQAGISYGQPIPVYLKVDTGMHRLGISPDTVLDMIRWIDTQKGVQLLGIMSHLAAADTPANTGTQNQLTLFSELRSAIRIAFPDRNFVFSLANSDAILRIPTSYFDQVRPGIMTMCDIVTLKSRVTQIRTVEAGHAIGYGWTHRATVTTRVAIVQAGYADGVKRSVSNRGSVGIHGKRYPIVGRVCMDVVAVDIDNADISVNDPVIIFGDGGPSLVEFAMWADTIPYEILTGIGQRVPRVYLTSERVDQ